MAYTLLDSVETTTAQTSILFQNIDQTHQDLVIDVYIPTSTSIRSGVYFNGVTSPSIFGGYLYVNNTTFDGIASYGFIWPYVATTINNQGMPFQYTFEIPDYTTANDKSAFGWCGSYDPAMVSGQLPASVYGAITQLEFYEASAIAYPAGTLIQIYGRS